MPNVSQRDSTAIPTGGEISARHSNHLRGNACGPISFLDWCIRDHQVLGQATSPHFSHREETAMIKIIKAQKLWSDDGSRTGRDNESLAFSYSLSHMGKLGRVWCSCRKEVLVLAISMIIYLLVYFSI
jgi:hypothetical protein